MISSFDWMDELAARASRLGYESVMAYALDLEAALRRIADAESGYWGRIARQALDGLHPSVPSEASVTTREDET